jgi:hypothetical protein
VLDATISVVRRSRTAWLVLVAVVGLGLLSVSRHLARRLPP